jgi:hypothetical protein
MKALVGLLRLCCERRLELARMCVCAACMRVDIPSPTSLQAAKAKAKAAGGVRR